MITLSLSVSILYKLPVKLNTDNARIFAFENFRMSYGGYGRHHGGSGPRGGRGGRHHGGGDDDAGAEYLASIFGTEKDK